MLSLQARSLFLIFSKKDITMSFSRAIEAKSDAVTINKQLMRYIKDLNQHEKGLREAMRRILDAKSHDDLEIKNIARIQQAIAKTKEVIVQLYVENFDAEIITLTNCLRDKNIQQLSRSQTTDVKDYPKKYALDYLDNCYYEAMEQQQQILEQKIIELMHHMTTRPAKHPWWMQYCTLKIWVGNDIYLQKVKSFMMNNIIYLTLREIVSFKTESRKSQQAQDAYLFKLAADPFTLSLVEKNWFKEYEKTIWPNELEMEFQMEVFRKRCTQLEMDKIKVKKVDMLMKNISHNPSIEGCDIVKMQLEKSKKFSYAQKAMKVVANISAYCQEKIDPVLQTILLSLYHCLERLDYYIYPLDCKGYPIKGEMRNQGTTDNARWKLATQLSQDLQVLYKKIIAEQEFTHKMTAITAVIGTIESACSYYEKSILALNPNIQSRLTACLAELKQSTNRMTDEREKLQALLDNKYSMHTFRALSPYMHCYLSGVFAAANYIASPVNSGAGPDADQQVQTKEVELVVGLK